MTRRRVVELADRQDADGLSGEYCTCVNPRCDVQFFRSSGPGRRREFCSEECRRTAERDLRRILALVEHHELQLQQLKARAKAYTRTTVDQNRFEDVTEDQVRMAREAVAEVRGMARFLPQHQGEFAPELLRLYDAVAPVIEAQP